jgi:hypothetical protein
MVSRTGIDENTSKEHERNALPDILMTMSQMPLPDVTRELAEVHAMFEVLEALRRKRGRQPPDALREALAACQGGLIHKRLPVPPSDKCQANVSQAPLRQSASS